MKFMSIPSLKEKYFQWRYWSNLYHDMFNNLENHHHKTNQECIPYINKPGVALSFDDSYRVHEWYENGKELFGYYDVKVTFNINGIHPLDGERKHNQEEIDKLLELQANGHEIGHHGFNHMKATDYSTQHGYHRWIKDEIELLLNWMNEQTHSTTKDKFKKPVSFAFPHFQYDKEHIKKLVPNYFKITRGHLNKDNLTAFNYEGFAPSICLDGYYSCNVYYLKKIIKLAKEKGENVIFTCHSIIPEEAKMEKLVDGTKADRWARWAVTTKLIQTIINEVRNNDMEFYTTSELAGIANIMDNNLESAVRKIIAKPIESKWLRISDLVNIKELDLSNCCISALDGIQYFWGLEKLNLANNNITDFRLLKKIPFLKEVVLNGNPGYKETLKIAKVN
ncbi:leucine-rich repeat domain-containing protein [Bacillus sp. USDA818B3_A]|uniref:leucine-rich repeat domain-containing protein n=1 Tax=Bacillus sp. USDA818B3_A TaxID=2698834 RepID=UPI001369B64B|nr:leucine-rich repeat domain-containing protein [Bacillus sp. USDA818B3_A]